MREGEDTVFKLGCGMFAEECRALARDYPDVAYDEVLVDTFAMKLVMKPQQFDVVVTTNTFGDILSDAAAGLVGGLGLAPALSAGPQRAMAQATHGSAPDIAGRNIAKCRLSHRYTQINTDNSNLGFKIIIWPLVSSVFICVYLWLK